MKKFLVMLIVLLVSSFVSFPAYALSIEIQPVNGSLEISEHQNVKLPVGSQAIINHIRPASTQEFERVYMTTASEVANIKNGCIIGLKSGVAKIFTIDISKNKKYVYLTDVEVAGSAELTLPQEICGENHKVSLLKDGRVYTAGSNEYGQCNTADWRNIIAVGAGKYQTVGLDSTGRLYVTGMFGSACVNTNIFSSASFKAQEKDEKTSEEKIAEVTVLIGEIIQTNSNITPFSYNQKDLIVSAYTKYKALTDVEKSKIEYRLRMKITKAEGYIADCDSKAAVVVNLINSITKEYSDTNINNANKKYSELPEDAVRDAVPNGAVLKNAIDLRNSINKFNNDFPVSEFNYEASLKKEIEDTVLIAKNFTGYSENYNTKINNIISFLKKITDVEEKIKIYADILITVDTNLITYDKINENLQICLEYDRLSQDAKALAGEKADKQISIISNRIAQLKKEHVYKNIIEPMTLIGDKVAYKHGDKLREILAAFNSLPADEKVIALCYDNNNYFEILNKQLADWNVIENDKDCIEKEIADLKNVDNNDKTLELYQRYYALDPNGKAFPESDRAQYEIKNFNILVEIMKKALESKIKQIPDLSSLSDFDLEKCCYYVDDAKKYFEFMAEDERAGIEPELKNELEKNIQALKKFNIIVNNNEVRTTYNTFYGRDKTIEFDIPKGKYIKSVLVNGSQFSCNSKSISLQNITCDYIVELVLGAYAEKENDLSESDNKCKEENQTTAENITEQQSYNNNNSIVLPLITQGIAASEEATSETLQAVDVKPQSAKYESENIIIVSALIAAILILGKLIFTAAKRFI